jgi:hypothetical protein
MAGLPGASVEVRVLDHSTASRPATCGGSCRCSAATPACRPTRPDRLLGADGSAVCVDKAVDQILENINRYLRGKPDARSGGA